MREYIIIKSEEEKRIIEELNKRNDVKAQRIKRLLNLPDLTKKESSPVKIVVDRIISLPRFQDFDIIEFPKIVSVEQEFDLLNTPKDHPSRKETDTYFIDSIYHLRTQTTVMWSFYLKDPNVLKKLEEEGEVKCLAPGIVFRKDEIDRTHYPAFHQIDGLLVCRREKKEITLEDLKEVEIDIAKSIFGEKIEYKFLVDSFPFTDPSLEMDIKLEGQENWMEVLGSGLVHPQVLKNFNLDPQVFNGWAFGCGVDRLAMVKMEIPDIRILWSTDPRITNQFKDINSKFQPISKYPPVFRDISFIIDKTINLNNYYEIVRDCGSDLIEEVKMIDQYEDPQKFGPEKKSYTFRIVYRSNERTLTNEEVNIIHNKIREITQKELNAVLR